MSEMEEMKKQLAAQDSMNIGGLEAEMAREKQEDKEGTDLFDVTEVKRQLRKSLLGGEYRRVYVDENGQIVNNKEEAVTDRVVFEQTSSKQLINEQGFEAIWAEVQGFLNNNVQGSYLPSQIIEKECKGTLWSLRYQIMMNYDVFDVENRQDAEQIMSILRKNLVAALHKSRGGRSMVNKERTLIEKLTRADTGEESSDGSSSVLGGLKNL